MQLVQWACNTRYLHVLLKHQLLLKVQWIDHTSHTFSILCSITIFSLLFYVMFFFHLLNIILATGNNVYISPMSESLRLKWWDALLICFEVLRPTYWISVLVRLRCARLLFLCCTFDSMTSWRSTRDWQLPSTDFTFIPFTPFLICSVHIHIRLLFILKRILVSEDTLCCCPLSLAPSQLEPASLASSHTQQTQPY